MKELFKKIVLFSMVFILSAAFVTSGMNTAMSVNAEEAYIDNSSLLPLYKPDSEVTLDKFGHPDWMKGLIMTQFRIETVTDEGTFQSAVKALDHCAETGINGIWINPIQERPEGVVEESNNGYGNLGPRTVEPTLTGTDDIEESYAVVKKFVDEAHKRNIRVIFDIVVWGTAKDSPLVTEHPDFYKQPLTEDWGGWAWNWNSRPLKDYMTESCVEFIEKTGADGFRVDLAPYMSGYYFKEVKEALLEKGKKIMVMSEHRSQGNGAFDIDQICVGYPIENVPVKEEQPAFFKKYGTPHIAFLFGTNNIVDMIKTGNLIGEASMQTHGLGASRKYYPFNLLTHDDTETKVRGRRVNIGYQAIFSPFIPIWFIGEEWNNPKNPLWTSGMTVDEALYVNKIDWSKLDVPRNRAFFEDVKKYIQIRRTNADVFEHFSDALRDTNIEKVASVYTDKGQNPNQAYARYVDKKAFIVVPNNSDNVSDLTVTPDYSIIGLGGVKDLKITDMYTEKELFSGTVAELKEFKVNIGSYDFAILKVEGSGLVEPTTTVLDGKPSSDNDTKIDDGTKSARPLNKTILIAAVAVFSVLVVVFAVLFAKKRKLK